MSIDMWWPRLRPDTRDWLIANNGDAVPISIMDEIETAGGPARGEDWWVAEDGAGPCMPDDAIDWIDEVANGESPTG